jgi:hypothetical protein
MGDTIYLYRFSQIALSIRSLARIARQLIKS